MRSIVKGVFLVEVGNQLPFLTPSFNVQVSA